MYCTPASLWATLRRVTFDWTWYTDDAPRHSHSDRIAFHGQRIRHDVPTSTDTHPSRASPFRESFLTDIAQRGGEKIQHIRSASSARKSTCRNPFPIRKASRCRHPFPLCLRWVNDGRGCPISQKVVLISILTGNLKLNTFVRRGLMKPRDRPKRRHFQTGQRTTT